MKTKKFTRKEIVKDWKKNKLLYLMAVPLIAFFIVFAYLPMGGILMAFENYKPKLGILRSQWVGLENFKDFFSIGICVACHSEYGCAEYVAADH